MAIVGKLLLLMLTIDIMLFIGGVNAGNDLLVFGDFLYINATRDVNGTLSNTSSYNISNTNLTGGIIPNQPGVTSSITDIFIIPILLAIDALNLIFSVLFAPSVFLAAIGAPFEISLLIGGTVMILYIIGFISIIRGYDL